MTTVAFGLHRPMRFLVAATMVCGTIGCAAVSSKMDSLPLAGVARADSLVGKRADLPDAEVARMCVATAEAYAAEGQWDHAVALYERSRVLDPRGPSYARQLGVLHARRQKHDRAVAEFRRALEESPRDADLWNDLGYSLQELGDHTQGERAYRRALELDPRHERAENNLGVLLAESGRLDESLRCFEKHVGPAGAHCNVAAVLKQSGRLDEARWHLDRALTLEPQLVAARRLREHW